MVIWFKGKCSSGPKIAHHLKLTPTLDTTTADSTRIAQIMVWTDLDQFTIHTCVNPFFLIWARFECYAIFRSLCFGLGNLIWNLPYLIYQWILLNSNLFQEKDQFMLGLPETVENTFFPSTKMNLNSFIL